MKPVHALNMHKSTVHFINEPPTTTSIGGDTHTDDSSTMMMLSRPPPQQQQQPGRFPLISSAPTHPGILNNSHNNYHHNNHHNQPPVQIVSNYYQSNVFALQPNGRSSQLNNNARKTAARTRQQIITRTNLIIAALLLALLLVYNAQNILFYKLNELTTDPSSPTIYFCAFDDKYADYFSMLTQFLVPFLNLFLFAILPLTLLTVQVLLDVCFLIRVRREQAKRYMKLSELIEWPLYGYYLVYMVSQLPYALHQLVDLASGTSKFPFVFPLFIQMKFSSHVWLVIVEQMLLFAGQSADLFIWLLLDKQMRELCAYWLNKRILCRTYTKV